MFLVLRRVVLGYNWTPEATLRACGLKSCKKFGKTLENGSSRPLFETLWALIDRLGRVWTTLGTVWTSPWGLQAQFFVNYFRKRWFVKFDATLRQKCYFCKSRRPSWSYLGPKVRTERSKVASQRGQDSKFCLVGSVLLLSYANGSEIAPPPSNFKSSRRSKSI